MSENSKRVLLANVFSMICILYRKQTDPCCVNLYQLVTIAIVNNQWQYWQIDDMIVGLQFTKKKRRDNCIYRRIPITDLFVNSYLFFSISSWNVNKERNDYTEDYMRCILKCKLFHTHPLLQIEKAMSFSLYRNVNRYLRFGFVSRPRIVRRIYLHQIYRDLSR